MRPSSLLIKTVKAQAFRIPTGEPETDGTLRWQATGVLVVQINTHGHTGLGYSYTDPSAAQLVKNVLQPVLAGADAWGIEALFEQLMESVRNLGHAGVAAAAISAVDTALWDLKAKALGQPLATLLGAGRYCVPVYGSGGFTSLSDEELRTQLGNWVHHDGCRGVKLKIGANAPRDLKRIEVARSAIGDANLMIDANGAHSARSAITFAHAVADLGVSWFEEPVSSDDTAGLARVRTAIDAAGLPIDIAAGEYAWHLDDAHSLLRRAAVDVLQIDATRCGGISGWKRIAALCHAYRRPCSAHCAPALHLHVACATPCLRHVEWFADHARIEAMFFEGAPVIHQGEIAVNRDRPGLGLVLKQQDIDRFKVWEG